MIMTIISCSLQHKESNEDQHNHERMSYHGDANMEGKVSLIESQHKHIKYTHAQVLAINS